jgi:hypothetical protein
MDVQVKGLASFNANALASNAVSGNDGYIVILKNTASTYRSFIATPAKTFSAQLIQSQSGAFAFLKKFAINTAKIQRVYATFPGFVAHITDTEATLLRSDPEVESVVLNQIFNAITGVIDHSYKWNPFPQNLSSGYFPGYSDATPAGVTRVGGGKANATTGNAVWILDSGCDLNNTELNIDQTRAANFVPGETSPQDQNGHGTHVAGIIGAKANNIGIVGVAPNALLVPVRVTNAQGSTSEATILAGLDYIQSMVVAHSTADIVNISLGFSGRNTSTVLDNKIIAMAELGIRLVIAAGNYNDDTQYYPMARLSHYNVYVIAAMDATNDNFAVYFPNSSQGSNYGASISYADPGVNVYSTYLGGYATLSGTSMATPHYTGVLMVPYVACGCPCDIGPFSLTLADQKQKQVAKPQTDFCFSDPAASYAHNVPNAGTEQIGVVTGMRYRPY